jgi:CxxC motif-containing protein (DUF1111 family)
MPQLNSPPPALASSRIPRRRSMRAAGAALALLGLVGCEGMCDPEPPPGEIGHGPIAEGIFAPMGEILPTATDEQRATFERGKDAALRRFDLADGLGPAFNLVSCAGCHEKPVTGGSGGLYRNFFLTGAVDEEGVFSPVPSAGPAGGVVRMYGYADHIPANPEQPPFEDAPDNFCASAPPTGGLVYPLARPAVDPRTNVKAQRNPIPFFGVGLMAALDEESLEAFIDEDDANNDGVSGRPNYVSGFIGRFGRKSQTTSIEAFIRGPLFNHLGITTLPLTNEMRARLPVDSSNPDMGEGQGATLWFADALTRHAQAGAPDNPNFDCDGVTDPEMSQEALFDLVSFTMLLAAPQFEELNDQRLAGLEHFDAIGCAECHRPRVEGREGPIPLYSDLLIHDMGEALADGLKQGEATGSEFRTQPLWGIAAVGPYLHDGRATTIDEAIRMHGGEGLSAKIRYERLDETDREDLIEFLLSLGGRSQATGGLLLPDFEPAEVGEYGGPFRELDEEELAEFKAGIELFDHEFGFSDGAGGPRLNGDSCRACHFDPVIGGAGPRDVNVMRHGIMNNGGEFVPPAVGTILHKTTGLRGQSVNWPQDEATIFEHRNTPHLFGLGLIDAIPEETILANADPDDTLVPDGISGRAAILDGGKLGRFGWKAQVPDLKEFVRDAVTAELGMTLPYEEGLTFGKIHDNDDIPDPEYLPENATRLENVLRTWGGPPRQPAEDEAAALRGEELFETVGCTGCHIPVLQGGIGPVPLYSDLLLHEILPPDAMGTEEGSASMLEFRTAPLWGLATSAPYLHSGAADTIHDAVLAHDGEAVVVRENYEALSDEERDDLLMFLGTL